MRKRLFLIAALLITLLCVFAVSAATEPSLPQLCPHCGTTADWQPLTEPATNNVLAEGHYYLACEGDAISGKAWYIEGKVCLHMNGKTVQASNRAFYIDGGELSLIGEGTVIGNAFTSTSAYGGAVYVKGTLNLYGPTVTTTGAEGRTTGRGGTVYLNGGTLNMYSGAITGGHATSGGTLYLASEGVANLYGGTLGGGTATTNGGSIYLRSGTTLNIAGAQVTGGACGNSGGCIYAGENSHTTMSAGSVSGGKSGSTGGCIYLYTDGIMDMSGGTVGNGAEGTHATGTSFYVRTGGIVNLSADASIHELRFPSLSAQTLGISGSYTGTVTLKANSYPDGQVVGPAENTDLTNASITIGDGSYYLVVKGNVLRLSRLGEITPATLQAGYCAACEKDVQWIVWDEEDCTTIARAITGHYRIGFEGESCYLKQKIIGGTDRVCLDLNGKTLYADRAIDVNTGVLNLLDTAGGGTIIGQGTNTTDASYGGAVYVRQNGTLNMYSGKLTYQLPTDGRSYVNRGGVVYVQGVLNLYGGEISGGAAITGSTIFGNVGTAYTSHIGLYGGTVTKGVAVPNGTTTGLCVMTRGTVSIGGNCQVDELLIENVTSSPSLSDTLQAEGSFSGSIMLQLPSFAGCTDIGTCTTPAPESITLGNDSAAQLLSVDGQLLALSGTPAVIAFHQDGTASAYETLTAAVSACSASDRLILMADVAQDVTVDKLVYLDLNGFDITGNISGTGTLACMDAKTKDFTVADGDYGRITGTVSCSLMGVSAEAPCSEDNYLMIGEADGISFHRVRLAITHSTLRPSCAGIYYNGDFYGDEKVTAMVQSLGIALNTSDVPSADNMQSSSLYTELNPEYFNMSGTSCLLSGIMKSENTDADNLAHTAMAVFVNAYVKLTDGTVLFGEAKATNLQEQAARIDEMWPYLRVAQKDAFVSMFRRFETVMLDESWTVANAVTVASWLNTFETTDYTQYLSPWTHDVVAEAKEDGKLHYYFMAGEGLLISETQTYKDKWGDAALIVFPNGQTMLIDSGPLAYAPVLLQNLQRMGITYLDYVLITHPHSDHQYGIFHEASLLGIAFTEKIGIGKVYYRGGEDPTSIGATRVSRACTDLNIDFDVMNKGDVLTFGDVRMECIWPMPGEGDGLIVGGEEINNMSVVTRFDYGEHSSLFTADLYTDGEKMILEQVDSSLLDVDFLKVPHHGYNTSSAFEFIEAISPEVAIATGRLPIPASVRSRYVDAGITFLDDRTNGYVEVTGAADGTLEYVVSRTEATDEAPEAGDDATPDGSED